MYSEIYYIGTISTVSTETLASCVFGRVFLIMNDWLFDREALFVGYAWLHWSVTLIFSWQSALCQCCSV